MNPKSSIMLRKQVEMSPTHVVRKSPLNALHEVVKNLNFELKASVSKIMRDAASYRDRHNRVEGKSGYQPKDIHKIAAELNVYHATIARRLKKI